MVRVQVGLTSKKHGSSHKSPVFASGKKKNRVRVGYFSGRVVSENSDRFAMSSLKSWSECS